MKDKNTYTCYIFDLDGTLLNTIADLGAACNYALMCCGHPQHRVEDVEKMVGNGINMLLLRALPERFRAGLTDCANLPKETEEEVQKMRAAFLAYYDEHNCDQTRPYPEIAAWVKELRERGCKLAVASNKYHRATVRLVEHFFPGVFDVVLGERSGIPRKPNPQVVEEILKTLNVGKKETLYVGDSLVDMETARRAGVDMLACPWGFVEPEVLRQAGARMIDE